MLVSTFTLSIFQLYPFQDYRKTLAGLEAADQKRLKREMRKALVDEPEDPNLRLRGLLEEYKVESELWSLLLLLLLSVRLSVCPSVPSQLGWEAIRPG